MNREKTGYKILVRADSGNRTGMGHITECLSLLKSLAKIAVPEVLFLTRDYMPGVEKIKAEGFMVQVISGVNNPDKDIKAVLSAAQEFKPNAVIVDLLRVDRADEGAVIINNRYLRQLHDKELALIAIFDDTVLSEVDADLLVDFHICQDEKFYAALGGEDKYCIGPEYALLDESYHQLAEQKKDIETPRKCKNIFVNQGGSDPYGLTAKILRALGTLSIDGKISVVVGGALKKEHINEIEGIRKHLADNYKFYFNIPPGEIRGIMAKSDLAITAAGNTLYELCALGVPSIVLSHHNDHDIVAQAFARHKAVVNLGIGAEVPEDAIARLFKAVSDDMNLRKELSRNAGMLVDGDGCRRLAEKIVKLLAARKVSDDESCAIGRRQRI